MSVAASFEAELVALLELAGPVERAEGRVSVRSGGLEIAATRAGEAVSVALAGWRRGFALTDDEDGEDAAALALDLIGAGLFGAARVIVEVFGGRPLRATLQVLRGADWQTVEVQGSRPWNPLARAVREVRIGATPRPAGRAPSPAAPLPWAPWAGLAGYYGAAAREALPAELPVDGELDLHNFRPREVKPLVLAYLEACLARGITEVRIVHGKGIGNLRRTVHALLERHPRVKGFRLGGHREGSWGATLVELSPETDEGAEGRG